MSVTAMIAVKETSMTIDTIGTAAVAPPLASAQKDASRKKAAPKGQKGTKGGKPKAAAPTKKAPATKVGRSPKNGAKAQESAAPRAGTKAAMVVAMLLRQNGATLVDVMKQTGWKKHTCRGFMVSARKLEGYAFESYKSARGEHTYRMSRQS
jgi:pyruvate/2-oxoglutarate dehydrogenase complex dihydrolipoamide acyltransferase (E2) component